MALPFLWILIVGCFVAFLTGAGVGMNDLSNAFGTTYGAKVLTLFQICILATICEFTGAISLGGAVTSTISGGIASTESFTDEPYVFMYGMLCASGAAFCWLAIATWLTLPVSSTHSICGGVIGFALVYGGGGGVKWAVSQEEFPFVGGVVPIILSWFISPALTGLVAAFIYGMVLVLVLRPANSVARAIYTLPVIVMIAFFLESFFVLYKGASSRLHWSVQQAAWVAAIIGVGAGALSCAFIIPLKRRVKRISEEAEEVRRLNAEADAIELGERQARENNGHSDRHSSTNQDAFGSQAEDEPTAQEEFGAPRKRGQRDTTTGEVVNENDDDDITISPHDVDKPEETVSGLTVQVFDSNAEYVYRYLQIFTAICASFAHGASDVSNAVGPLAAIFGIYKGGTIDFPKETPIWVLALGGCGLVIGLSTFGVRLMSLLGEKITVITPSRGFSAELSAALVVSFASGYGIPVSSTHCITGAVVAIGMVDVGFCKVKWLMVLKMYTGWVFTLVATAVMSATFFSQGVYSPQKRA